MWLHVTLCKCNWLLSNFDKIADYLWFEIFFQMDHSVWGDKLIHGPSEVTPSLKRSRTLSVIAIISSYTADVHDYKLHSLI